MSITINSIFVTFSSPPHFCPTSRSEHGRTQVFSNTSNTGDTKTSVSSLKIRTISATVDATCSWLVIYLLQHIVQYYWFGSQVLYHGQHHARRVIGSVVVCYSCFSRLRHDQEEMSSKSVNILLIFILSLFAFHNSWNWCHRIDQRCHRSFLLCRYEIMVVERCQLEANTTKLYLSHQLKMGKMPRSTPRTRWYS